MNKLSIVIMSAAVVLGVCSCGSGIKTTAQLDNAADSLCYGMGYTQGNRLAEIKAMGMYPELNALEIEPYLQGFAEARNITEKNKSYYIGVNDGLQMKKNLDNMASQLGIEANFEEFLVAFAQALRGDTTLAVNKDNIDEMCNNIIASIREANEKAELDSIAATPEAVANLEAGRAFLAAKEQEEGVKKTESGLLYKVIKEGKGETFKPTQRIELGYVGKFINDTIFDQNSSIQSLVSRFVPGFSEGLQLMSPGAKYIFYIPSDLAYGIRGNEAIPSNSTLIFEVETKGLAN